MIHYTISVYSLLKQIANRDLKRRIITTRSAKHSFCVVFCFKVKGFLEVRFERVQRGFSAYANTFVHSCIHTVILSHVSWCNGSHEKAIHVLYVPAIHSYTHWNTPEPPSGKLCWFKPLYVLKNLSPSFESFSLSRCMNQED